MRLEYCKHCECCREKNYYKDESLFQFYSLEKTNIHYYTHAPKTPITFYRCWIYSLGLPQKKCDGSGGT